MSIYADHATPRCHCIGIAPPRISIYYYYHCSCVTLNSIAQETRTPLGDHNSSPSADCSLVCI